MTLRHKTRFNTSGQGFKKDPIRNQCYLYYRVERPFRLLMKFSEDICFYLPRFVINAIFTIVLKDHFAC